MAVGFATFSVMGALLGYARVSTSDQDAALQIDALTQAGCYKVFVDQASGSLDERPELSRLMDQIRPGDTLVVWRLDLLGRSIRHLIDSLRYLIRERTLAGLSAARARGRQGGRPPTLSADQVKTARRMYEQRDMTVEQIGDVLGVSRTTIYRALRTKTPPKSQQSAAVGA